MYVPILKWRQGEYLALDRLDDSVKDGVFPFVEIPPIEWDFENETHAKDLDEHLEPFSRRLDAKWKSRDAFLDLNFIDPMASMRDGKHPLTHIFESIRNIGNRVIPVTGLSRNNVYQDAVKSIVAIDKYGVCFRLHFRDIVSPSCGITLGSLVKYFGLNIKDVDIVLDLGKPSFHPIGEFARVIYNSAKKIPQIKVARSFTIAATNFPDSMGGLNQGINYVERLEWAFYSTYHSLLNSNDRIPWFGDYSIANPKLLQMDMRLVKPAASIRYTVDDAWHVHKGTSVRKNGFTQFKNICQDIVNSNDFAGEMFSHGDKYIKECSIGKASTGNLTVWRWVATNHHITKIVNDCANFP